MWRLKRYTLGPIVLLAILILAGLSGQAQKKEPPRAPDSWPPARIPNLDDGLLHWPLPPGATAYAAIDGKHIHKYVEEQAEISRRYRDQGHQLWGRIIGTSGDAESAEWMAGKFKSFGLTDVRIQPFDLQPQWSPESWDVTVTSGDKTVHVTSAMPAYGSVGTSPQGLDLEAAYVGLGTEADFGGRNVRGQAVFTVGWPMTDTFDVKDEGELQRADAKGAAAIFFIQPLPGNMQFEPYPANAKGPVFVIGGDDGAAVRELIEKAPAGQPPHVKVRMDIQRVPNRKTALVWGTLPGASDETIYIYAHRDGWFDAANDNAAGVAQVIGLAEYYAKVPKAKRPRTMVFIGIDGHHNSGAGGAVGGAWMRDHAQELFSKTILAINCEHPAAVETVARPRYVQLGVRDASKQNDITWSNTYIPQQWYAGGPSRPTLQAIAVKAFKDFGVPTYVEPNATPPAGDGGRVFRYAPLVATSEFYHYFHTDLETPETVPWTGLEATTRAYARIVDEVNKLKLADLQRPFEPEPTPAPAPRPPSGK